MSRSYHVTIASRGSTLDPMERWVLTCVAMRESPSSGCYASASTLADDTGLTERSVGRVVARLVSAGVLSADTRPGRTTVYRTHVQAIRTPDTESEVGVVEPPPTQSPTPPTQSPTTPDTESDDPSLDPFPHSISTPQTPRKRGASDLDLEAFITKRVQEHLDRLATEPTADNIGVPLHLVDEDTLPGLLDEAREHRRTALAELLAMFARADGQLVDAILATPGCPTKRRRGVPELVRQAAAAWRARGPPDPVPILEPAPPPPPGVQHAANVARV